MTRRETFGASQILHIITRAGSSFSVPFTQCEVTMTKLLRHFNTCHYLFHSDLPMGLQSKKKKYWALAILPVSPSITIYNGQGKRSSVAN